MAENEELLPWFPADSETRIAVSQAWMPSITTPADVCLGADIVRRYCAQVEDQARRLGYRDGDLIAIADMSPCDVALGRIACAILGYLFASENAVTEEVTLRLRSHWDGSEPSPVLTRVKSQRLPRLRELADAAGTRPCYVMTTSGSTGASRRAVIPVRALNHVFSALASRLEDTITAGVPWMGFHSPSFGFSLFELFGCISFRGDLRLVAPPERGNYSALVAEIRSVNRQCVVSLTPSELSLFLRDVDGQEDVLPACIVLSGEAASRGGLGRLFARPDIADSVVINTYAAVESAGQIAVLLVDRDNHASVYQGRVGSPLPGIHVSTDAEDGRGPGEILVSGPTIALGYLERAATEARFEGSPPRLRTGDLGYIDDSGQIFVTGRVADTRKVGGRWLDFGLLERRVNEHPAVSDVALCALSADPQSETADILGVLIVPAQKDASRQIRRFFVDELAVVQTIRIETASEIPSRRGGKRDLEKITTLLQFPVSSHDLTTRDILRLWRDVLGRGVDVNRNLFESGVDSLGISYAATRLSEVLGRTVAPAELLAFPTVRLQAMWLGGDTSASSSLRESRAARRAAWREARAGSNPRRASRERETET
ncbi:non-ribosomal peptide synthetase [Microbacterium sp.]|uniref:non-ribosomal peptide synthetase n=1 Tax=Microbacterium sp. TaxID=51671 RepID=UPI0039E2D118